LATRALIRLVGRTVRAIGVCLMAGAVAGLTHSEMSRASEYFAAVVAQVPVGPSVSEPANSPRPSPRASATPGPGERRGGPLEFGLNGSLSLGASGLSATRGQPNGNGGAVGQNQSNATGAVGLSAELRRRTPNATIDLRFPVGFSNNGSQIGSAVLTYSTPHYALAYGGQPVDLFGQLALGSTLRGPALVLPFGSGDITFYEGAAFGADLETVHVRGMRARRMIGRDLFEFGVVRNAPGPLTGGSSTVFLGVASSRGSSSVVAEIARQERTVPEGRLHGTAAQVRVDLGGASRSWSLTYRHIPERFLGYGSGEFAGDDFTDVGFHGSFGSRSFFADVANERTTIGDNTAKTRRSSLSYGGLLGASNYQFTLQEQRIAGSQPSQWTGSATLQLGVPMRAGFALLGAQVGRTTGQGLGATGTAGISAQMQHQFGPLSAQVSFQQQRASNPFGAVSRLRTTVADVSRQFGRTGIGLSYTMNRTQSPYADALQRTPLLTVLRQLSPALSVQASFGTQSIQDRLNPQNSGRSRVFSLGINAPFSFGNGVVQGRVDPRLPAIIAGRVVSDLGDNPVLSSLASGGVGNIVVVLDNADVQRTDLDGNFQFSFVSPGQHQLRLESASLPRGLTADQPVVTINVQGGQSAQVSFRVGNFGGVSGRVFGRDARGASVPLQNVLLRIDGAAYAQTDRDGVYGFGRLSPGPHTIAIVENTVPAFASFSPDEAVRKVSVRDGQILSVDFLAAQLGSITGVVTYRSGLKPPFVGGVQNAYVVAEPGEHAAITSDDGSFVIDNLPAGAYSVSVDPETLPDGMSQDGPAMDVTLVGSEGYRGVALSVGETHKNVVFSFLGAGASAATLKIDDGRLPPGATTSVSYAGPPGVSDVSLKIFDHVFDLVYDAKRAVWRGTIDVPAGTKAGSYDAVASAKGIATAATATLTVDPNMPIVLLQVTPADVQPGGYATVRARFLVDVRAGDSIAWSDGSRTVLGRPIAGRVFTFRLHVTLRPLYGTLLTARLKLPIRLL